MRVTRVYVKSTGKVLTRQQEELEITITQEVQIAGGDDVQGIIGETLLVNLVTIREQGTILNNEANAGIDTTITKVERPDYKELLKETNDTKETKKSSIFSELMVE